MHTETFRSDQASIKTGHTEDIRRSRACGTTETYGSRSDMDAGRSCINMAVHPTAAVVESRGAERWRSETRSFQCDFWRMKCTGATGWSGLGFQGVTRKKLERERPIGRRGQTDALFQNLYGLCDHDDLLGDDLQ